ARTAAETHERVEIVLAMQKITKRARHARDRVGYGERTGAGHRSGASGQESRQHGRATHVARLHVQELRTCLATVAGIAGVEREVMTGIVVEDARMNPCCSRRCVRV